MGSKGGAVRKKRGGRPTKFTERVAREICDKLADGASLHSICKDPRLPAESTFRGWCLDNREGIAAVFERASKIKAAGWGDELVELADAPVPRTPDGRVDQGAVNQRKLRINTRQWVISRMLPKVWGDRQTVEHAGSVRFTIITNVPTPDLDGDENLEQQDSIQRAQRLEHLLRAVEEEGGDAAAFPAVQRFAEQQRLAAQADGQETKQWWNGPRGGENK